MIEGEPLTAREQALWDAGQAAVKNTVPTLNDMLGKLVTLNTALIGGGLVVAKGDALPFWWAVVVLLMLLVSLAAALRGLWPQRNVYDLSDVEQLEMVRRELVQRKADCLTVAGIVFVLAVFAAIAGLISRGIVG